MEIILSKDDIVALIKKAYFGVKEVKFNTKTLKITLDVTPQEFFANTQATQASTPIIPAKVLTDEEKRMLALKKGNMMPGGRERNIKHMG